MSTGAAATAANPRRIPSRRDRPPRTPSIARTPTRSIGASRRRVASVPPHPASKTTVGEARPSENASAATRTVARPAHDSRPSPSCARPSRGASPGPRRTGRPPPAPRGRRQTTTSSSCQGVERRERRARSLLVIRSCCLYRPVLEIPLALVITARVATRTKPHLVIVAVPCV